jgi:hypothetical protein
VVTELHTQGGANAPFGNVEYLIARNHFVARTKLLRFPHGLCAGTTAQ